MCPAPGISHPTAGASTAITNLIIERKGAPTGLITTEGFRDILEIGRELRELRRQLDEQTRREQARQQQLMEGYSGLAAIGQMAKRFAAERGIGELDLDRLTRGGRRAQLARRLA